MSDQPSDKTIKDFYGLADAEVASLDDMIAAARKIKMTPEQEEEQRLSFVYGNCKIENDLITREMVAEAAERLRQL